MAGRNINNLRYADDTTLVAESEEELKSLLMKIGGRKAEIQTAGTNINNLRYADDTTLMAEREEELNILLMKVKDKSEMLA